MQSLNPAMAAFSRVPWKHFRNMSDETCPVGGVLRIESCILDAGEIVARCNKPDDTAQSIYLVNVGPHDVPPYTSSNPYQGQCSPLTHHAGIVLIDDSVSSPAFGDFWGPEEDEWHLTNSSSLGKFLVLSERQDEPPRVIAMQVSVPGPQRALARLTSAVAACNLNGTTLLTLAAGNMPSGTAEPHFSAADGADVQFDTASSAVTIYNPTPFAYPNATLVWIVKAADHWVIEKAAEWTPRAFFWEGALSPDLTQTASADTLVNLKTTGHFNSFEYLRGGIASLTGTFGEVRLDCPVNNRQFRVSWGGTVLVQVSSGAASLTEVVLGPAISGAHYFPGTQAFEATGTQRTYALSGSGTMNLSQGQILGLRSLVTASGFVQQIIKNAWLMIEPLF